MALIEFDAEDLSKYLDYKSILNLRAERVQFDIWDTLFKKDPTFSAEDVIRIYSSHLTLGEQATVKEFFLKLLPGLIQDIYNAQVWLDPYSYDIPHEERETITFTSITLWDLIVRTVNLVYEMLDAIKDIVTLDLFAFIRLKNYYERLVALSQDWYNYWKRTYSVPYNMEGQNYHYPWWSW